MTRLTVKDIINSQLAVSTEKGEMVFEAINSHLQKDEKVIVDFKGIDLMITAFLNAAIGKLYGNKNYSGSFLNEHIKLENIEKDDISLFKDVIERAKEYFEDKEGFDKNANSVIYGED
jgi:hypothetical protein